MDNNGHDEHLENITKVMNSAMDSMKLSQSSIDRMITPELMGSMSPAQIKIISKSKELIGLGLKNPQKILDCQKEIAELMDTVRVEAEQELKHKTE